MGRSYNRTTIWWSNYHFNRLEIKHWDSRLVAWARAFKIINKGQDFFLIVKKRKYKKIILKMILKRLCKRMKFHFQSNSVKNSLKCPKVKPSTHCLTVLFPFHQNNNWTIKRWYDRMIVVLYLRLSDFCWMENESTFVCKE